MKKRMSRTLIFFLLITAVSLFFRLYHLGNRIWWYGDTTRDMLVASHIVKYGEFPLAGHNVASLFGSDSFRYPPYYYYGLAVLYLVSHNPMIVMGILICIEALLPGILFLVGSIVFSFPIAVLSGLFLAISSFGVSMANVWSAYTPVPFFYLGLLLIEYSKKRHTFVWQYTGIGLMIIAGTISLPIIVCAGLVILGQIIEQPTWKRRLALLLFSVVLWLSLYIPLYVSSDVVSVISHFLPKSGFVASFTISRYLASYKQIWNMFFDYARMQSTIPVWIVGFFCVINYKNVLRCWKRGSYIITLFFALPLIGTLAYVETYEYVSLFPIFLLFISFVFLWDWDHFSGMKKIITAIGIIVMTYCLLGNMDRTFASDEFYYLRRRNIVDFIEQDAKLRHIIPFFSITAGGRDTSPSWEGPSFWFFQEYTYNQKVSRVINDGENIELIMKTPPYMYLICWKFVSKTSEKCQIPFLKDNPMYSFQYELIHPFGTDYKIFLYKKIY